MVVETTSIVLIVTNENWILILFIFSRMSKFQGEGQELQSCELTNKFFLYNPGMMELLFKSFGKQCEIIW